MRSTQFSKRPSLRSVCTLLGALGLLPACCLISPAGAIHELQGGHAKTKTIQIPFTSHDGYEMFGKLTIPDSAGRYPVVIYVQTAEGMTIDMKRPDGRGGTFNYFDVYREKLPAMNVAFFSYGISTTSRIWITPWVFWVISSEEHSRRDTSDLRIHQ